MKLRTLTLGAILIAALAACQKAETASTPTPNQESIQAAGTLFAQPTRPPRTTPTSTPQSDIELELSRTTAGMEEAVLAGDFDRYMSYVWPDDPVFYQEQTAWARDWEAHPLGHFEVNLSRIDTPDPNMATARTTILWTQEDASRSGSSGGTTITAVFRRAEDRWLYAGAQWETLETDGFELQFFETPLYDNRHQAEILLAELPGVYTRITRELDYTPDTPAQLKLYDSAATLQTVTRISMSGLSQWVAPGEAIKMTLGVYNTAPETAEAAREYTRYVLYAMAGGTQEPYPWWLEQGMGEYGASLFRTLSQRTRVLERVAAVAGGTSTSSSSLLPWDTLVTVPALSSTQRQFAIDQSYTLVLYVREVHGADALNAWLKAIAGGAAVEDATQDTLGTSVDELDAAWREWLPQQIN
ncbi:MAG TPA: hypothetical protein PKD09_20675 [Aggregatilinea sp.]|uniref:peptidase MA family metallohydrolase n=1 Tax=Aggregatilinea sp. TaxID=2806333 RepID=UPI002CC66B15|nr:hypothetical protein [Aggregatilinea sp.]HML24083.1 hypothetical protein [Aggregatilinea sp.]